MAHRINERNSGYWSVDGEPKIRRTKRNKELSTNEKLLLAQVLEKVLSCLAHDSEGRGHLSPESRWNDEGNFTLSVTGAQRDELYKALEKLQ